ncbi:hypothetical protein Tco_1505788 [Tanacetum coccineum]
MSIPHNNMGPPPARPPPPPNNGPPPVVRPNGQAPRSMEELCQPSIDGRGGPISPIPIQATDFGLRHHMIQQVQNTCQFHGLPGDDANRHIDKFFGNYSTYETKWGLRCRPSLVSFPIFLDASCYRMSPEVVRQLEMMNKNFVEMMRQIQSIKSVHPKYKTCGGPYSFTECPAADGYTQEAVYATTGDVKAITTRSGVSYNGPTIPPTPSLSKEVERETDVTKDKVQNTSLGSTTHVQPSVVQDSIPEPEVAPNTNPKPSIPYPSRLNDQKLREKANNQMLKFLQIFQRLHFDISFADALLYMPKFASTFKS